MKRVCPYCQTESNLYFCSKDYNRKINQATFDYYRCSRCELIFLAPIPAELAHYYPDEYHGVPKSAEDLEVISKYEKYKIEIIQRFFEKGTLLEIGPSYGGFAYLAKKAGFEVDAIEMNTRCCQFLKEVVGVDAINSDNPIEVLQHKKNYDVIVLWHVIEHLPNPWLLLDVIFASLKPDGIIALATPNPEAFQFKVMGRLWPHLDSPRHVMLVPIKLLVEKLESLGMKKELITTKDLGSSYLNIFGWKHFFRRQISHGNIRKAVSKVGRLVAFILSPIEKIEGKGSAYTMVFRKAA
jgi:2-polyprenyl-3-methyl-5-hydroxy-6-metoxy-1,4-benzoquinol methylase